MYSWVQNNGIFLKDKERKEIKKIMNEYRNYSIIEKEEIIKFKEKDKKKIIEPKKMIKTSEWRSLP